MKADDQKTYRCIPTILSLCLITLSLVLTSCTASQGISSPAESTAPLETEVSVPTVDTGGTEPTEPRTTETIDVTKGITAPEESVEPIASAESQSPGTSLTPPEETAVSTEDQSPHEVLAESFQSIALPEETVEPSAPELPGETMPQPEPAAEDERKTEMTTQIPLQAVEPAASDMNDTDQGTQSVIGTESSARSRADSLPVRRDPAIQPVPVEDDSDPITFSGGFTRVKLQEGREVITLSGGAEVSVGSMKLTADSIDISGNDYRYVQCDGNVAVDDSERGIQLSASQLYYDRIEDLIIVDGWVELQDTENEVIASSAWLEFDLKSGIMRLQMRVRLLKHTDKGSMVCSADNVIFDRDGETLALNGGASVYWNKDRYEASMITVDLKTDEIVMDGAIKGTVHG